MAKDEKEELKKQWNDEDEVKINELIRIGHTLHCSCRQVWGDGECECGYKVKEKDSHG